MKVCNPLTHSLTQSYMQVQYAKNTKAVGPYICIHILYILYKIWSKTLQYVNCPLRLLDPAWPKQYAQRLPKTTLFHLYKMLASSLQVQYAQN